MLEYFLNSLARVIAHLKELSFESVNSCPLQCRRRPFNSTQLPKLVNRPTEELSFESNKPVPVVPVVQVQAEGALWSLDPPAPNASCAPAECVLNAPSLRVFPFVFAPAECVLNAPSLRVFSPL